MTLTRVPGVQELQSTLITEPAYAGRVLVRVTPFPPPIVAHAQVLPVGSEQSPKVIGQLSFHPPTQGKLVALEIKHLPPCLGWIS